MATTPTPPTPQRCIRAHYNTETITVYQAYNADIASAAISTQRLNASPLYAPSRMTWIKPSWNWTMYRSGYTFKDANQSHILAIRMKHAHFIELLRHAVLAGKSHVKGESVVVQWDPERGARLERLDYRSIQIGIPGKVREKWIDEWIVGIEDVTEMAREMKRVLDEEGNVDGRLLVERGVVPEERVYDVPDDVQVRLGMK
ncbi:hypothetical protein Slin14017_G033250 [Septoria linicola]|nr:hypothetical protein Slin14017_G033250 [Septoria linicola]